MSKNAYIFGRNAVIEALNSSQVVEKVFISFRSQGSAINEIYTIAKKFKIPVVKYDAGKFRELEQKAGADSSRSQGVVALKEIVEDTPLDDLFDMAFGKSEYPVIVALDGIEDPQNLGAIARSVEASGAAGMVLTTKFSARVTPSAVKASTGALGMVPISKVETLEPAIDAAKKAGYKVIGTDMKAKKLYTDFDYNFPVMLVIGSESKGISLFAREACDEIIKINMPGKIESLNASVSTGIILFEIIRKRLL
ncbi:23S rRNA (guanosine(2251)-2'-O)-methyltransferase RlmB [Candidatus Kapabacteria bacterium]|nr:23S rRNA (guanosine(2251)-2'-O)-methyltransferase RlmB [Candidatus Kapabacteria bacterium]